MSGAKETKCYSICRFPVLSYEQLQALRLENEPVVNAVHSGAAGEQRPWNLLAEFQPQR